MYGQGYGGGYGDSYGYAQNADASSIDPLSNPLGSMWYGLNSWTGGGAQSAVNSVGSALSGFGTILIVLAILAALFLLRKV